MVSQQNVIVNKKNIVHITQTAQIWQSCYQK